MRNTPTSSEEIVRCIFSSWRPLLMPTRICFSTRRWTEYLYEPNRGMRPLRCKSRTWKYCFVNGRTGFLDLLLETRLREIPLVGLHGLFILIDHRFVLSQLLLQEFR